MIKNQRQYVVTKAQIRTLENAIVAAAKSKDRLQPQVFNAMIDGIKGEVEELGRQVAEFEALTVGRRVWLESLKELPAFLIKRRIGKGYSQKDFAVRLGLKPQQIQRYEETDYQSASLRRVTEVMEALDIDMKNAMPQPGVRYPPFVLSTDVLREAAGVDMDRLRRKLLECESGTVAGR